MKPAIIQLDRLNTRFKLIGAAVLLCTVGFATNAHADVKTVATNLRGFGVPFRIDANDDSYIEVQLYLSRDEGQTWQFYARQTTDQEEFPFFADRDGTYWFSLKTLNRDRRLVPEGDTGPELKIVVDTVKPKLDFQIETDAAGRVACRWKATDKHIQPASLKILYQPGLVSQTDPAAWRAVDAKLADNALSRGGVYADQIAWWPETDARKLSVRIEISDTAGNMVHQDRQVVVPMVAWKSRPSSTARPALAPRQNSVASNSNANTRPETSAPAEHPPGVVCENGVCRLAPTVPKTVEAKTAKTKTVQTATELYGIGIARQTFKPSSHRPPQHPSQQTVAKKPASQNQQPTKVAARPDRLASRPTAFEVIGSPPENAAPPVPAGYSPPAPAVARVAVKQHHSSRRSGSVSWQSQRYQWTPKNQSAFSTTLRPDPALSPAAAPLRSLDRGPLAHVRPNAQIELQRGQQNLAQSSTNFPDNQYQGLGKSPSVDSVNTNPPELLPSREATRSTALPGERMKFQSRSSNTQQSRDPNSLGPLQNFANQRSIRIEPSTQSQTNSVYRKSAYGPAANPGLPPAMDSANRADGVSRAAIQMISTKRFRLDYAIDSIDPSGVAKVDLWMTRDNGRQWTLWGSDPDNVSPFPVQLNDEGRFGFRVVIHSRDGLTGRGPSSGDRPDMFVHIDSRPPLTKITSVPYGRNREAGKLVINYSVSDPFLTLRPVSLAYSRGPQGPWTLIEAGLRNSGRYVWKVGVNVPERIFLRIDSIDQAGNVGVHQLSQAIDVSGLVPRGTIRGVTPVSTRN